MLARLVRQMNSDVADTFHLAAVDLRGHGAIEQQMARIAHAQIRMMANAGHACFWDEAAPYNRCLQEFVEAL